MIIIFMKEKSFYSIAIICIEIKKLIDFSFPF